MRVEKENHAFAKRLFEQQAIIQKKAFDREFQSMKKYRQNLLKVPKDAKHTAMRSSSVSQLNGDDSNTIIMPSPFLKSINDGGNS